MLISKPAMLLAFVLGVLYVQSGIILFESTTLVICLWFNELHDVKSMVCWLLLTNGNGKDFQYEQTKRPMGEGGDRHVPVPPFPST